MPVLIIAMVWHVRFSCVHWPIFNKTGLMAPKQM